MSFIIETIINGQMYMASDMMISSLSGTRTYQDQSKIMRCSNGCAVGVAGEFITARNIVRLCQIQNVFTDYTNAVKKLELTMNAEIFRRRVGNLPQADCTLMLAYQGLRKGELAVLILAEGKAQVFQEPLMCEGHQFFFSSPVDVEFEECLQLCQTALRQARRLPPKTLLTNLVCEVAKRSAFVNTHVDLWKPTPPYM